MRPRPLALLLLMPAVACAPTGSGGPQRPRAERRSSGCGGTFVTVTVRPTALDGSTLDRVARDLLAPVRATVGTPSLSPAIRAFRVQVRDAAAADQVVTALRTEPRVENVGRDGCGVMIEGGTVNREP